MQTHAITPRDHGRERGKHRLASRAALLILCVSTSGCVWYRSPRATEESPNQQPAFPFDRIELQHLGCLNGDCPVYSVAISGNGILNYHGYRHVAVTGHRRGKMRTTLLRRLTTTLNDPAVFWLHARYTPGNGDCGAWSMDDTLVRIEINTPTFSRQILHYLGCHGAPMLLNRIEDEIDRAVDGRQWVRRPTSAAGTRPTQH